MRPGDTALVMANPAFLLVASEEHISESSSDRNLTTEKSDATEGNEKSSIFHVSPLFAYAEPFVYVVIIFFSIITGFIW
jgi:hypothetical protein